MPEPSRPRSPRERAAVVVVAALAVVLGTGGLLLSGRPAFASQVVANTLGIAVGLVIVWRGGTRAARRLGWLLTLAMLSIIVGSFAVLSDWLLERGHVQAARWSGFVLGSLDAPGGLGVLSNPSLVPVMFLAVAYPTGRLAPGWAWYPWAIVGVMGVATVAATLGPVDVGDVVLDGPLPDAIVSPTWDTISETALIVASLLFLASLWSLRQRFHAPRTSWTERQQIRWFAFGLGSYVVIVLTLLVLEMRGVISFHTFIVVDGIAFTAIPLSLGVAILRYRLHDIERIVSRTLGYALTLAVLTGVFVLLVTTPVLVLGSETDDLPPLLVSVSTLVVAALFNPVRRHLLTALDRRFDRGRYDAEDVVQRFAARVTELTEREQIDAGLAEVLSRTVAPTSVAVWLAEHDDAADLDREALADA